jgi:hypothetical protein
MNGQCAPIGSGKSIELARLVSSLRKGIDTLYKASALGPD